MAYLRALMTASRISNYAELSRLTGVSQNQFSSWGRGLSQPKRETLKRIAPALGVPPVNLYLVAGLDDEEDLALTGQVDLSAWPPEFHDLHDAYERAAEIGQGDMVLQSISLLVSGLKAQIGAKRDQPSGRRKAG